MKLKIKWKKIMEITIIIPEFDYPERLAQCLYGLVNNSYYKHNIFVITSDHYPGIDKYTKENKQFIDDNKIYFIDISLSKKNVSKYFLKYNIEKPEIERWRGGIDTAFKVNFGIDLAKTDYIMPNFDDDFYPSKNWDLNLFNSITAESDKQKNVYLPTHVQPYTFQYLKENYGMSITDNDINIDWIWNESRKVACNRLIIPTNRDPISILGSEWNSFVNKYSINSTITEPCGNRQLLHYLPMLFKKSDILEIGGYTLMGSGYELDVDNRFRDYGYVKKSRQDSFILHKGNVEVDK